MKVWLNWEVPNRNGIKFYLVCGTGTFFVLLQLITKWGIIIAVLKVIKEAKSY